MNRVERKQETMVNRHPSERGKTEALTHRLVELREFIAFLKSGADWRTLRAKNSAQAMSFELIRAAFADLANDDETMLRVVEHEVQQLEAVQANPADANDRTIAGYRERAQRLQDLIAFFKAGGDWKTVDATDPVLAAGLRDTYKRLEQTSQADLEYKDKGLSLAQVAEALIKRFTDKAAVLEAAKPKPMAVTDTARLERPLRVDRPREINEIAELQLPNETSQAWQILRVSINKRTYIIGRVSDQRSPSNIIADVIGNRNYRGAAAGYEISWEDFEKLYQIADREAVAA